jgi:5'-methylthioadenosine phosphorylase
MTEKPIHIGVIGGSGLYQMPGLEKVRELQLRTPFGDPSDALIAGELDGVPVVFLPRHGAATFTCPAGSYRANIYALKSLGVQQIVSVSACGSLKESLAPEHSVIPDQLFDFTKDRPRTFFGDGLVAHISTADPFCPELSATLADAAEQAGGTVHRGGTLITIEGPRFSTKGESRTFRAWGMDIIGMTACPEAFLAREAGMCYATMAHVTDYDVWHTDEETVTVEMVIQRLNANVETAQKAIRLLVGRLAIEKRTCTCCKALETAIITAHDHIPQETREALRVIVEPYL